MDTAQTSNNINASQISTQSDPKLKFKKVCVILSAVLLSAFILGLLYLSGIEPNPAGGQDHSYSMWLVIAYLAGLSMIFLPCTFPLVFVIVPLCLGKDYKKGLLMAVLFGLGLSITLSIYGVGIAYLGSRVGLDRLTESILIIAGIAAYFLALSELGFVRFKIPTYSGQIPQFIQSKNDYLKTFFLGLFLGNAGVGCPNPWFYFMLAYIARSADINKGLTLGFVHGIGRAVPLILLAVLGLLGINYAKQILKNKERVEKTLGWILVFVAAFILANGVFSHEWYVQSGIHSFWEVGVRSVIGEKFGERIEHVHEVSQSPFYTFGNYILVVFFVLPLFWYFNRKYIFNVKRKTAWEIIFRFITVVIFVAALYPLIDRSSENDAVKNLFAVLLTVLGLVIFYFWSRSERAILREIKSESQLTAETEADMRKKFHAFFKIIITVIVLLLLFTQYFPNSTPKHQMITVDAGIKRSIIAQGIKVNFSLAPEAPIINQSTVLKFALEDEKSEKAITDLQIMHTKDMHLILVNSDLTQFNHLHPVLQGGAYIIEHNFTHDGSYKLWIDFKRNNVERLVSFDVSTVGNANITDKSVLDLNSTNTVDGYTINLINIKNIKAHKSTSLKFNIKDVNGNIIKLDNLEEYLGAQAHFITISQDLKEFSHGHVEKKHKDTMNEHNNDHGLKIIEQVYADGDHADTVHESEDFISANHVFKQAGLHKIWLEFKIRGVLIRSSFVVNVE